LSFTVTVFSNKIPEPFGKNVQDAVIEGIGGRPGDWTIALFAPQNKAGWNITIEEANGFRWEKDFSGPIEQAPAFILQEVERSLPR
jgi:hypothetical protein